MTPLQIKKIFQRLRAQNPEPRSELLYSTHFELLIAVILSAQATDVSVNKVTPALFKIANTPHKMAALGLRGLIPYIKTIGLYNSKAKHIIETCHCLVEKHQGQVPNDRTALEQLPGVGRKTASVILNVAFGKPTIAVDTHIFRVSHRLGLASGSTPLAVEKQLEKIIPNTFKLQAHHWLILHGRYVCKARKPHCAECVLSDLCRYNRH